MQVSPYQRLYWIAALACVTALVYWPSTSFLYGKWVEKISLTYTHGWLTFLICIALVVRSRRELAAAPVQPSVRAAVALAAAIIVWLISYRASIEGLEVPLQPLIFWLAVTAAFGWKVGRLLLFPVAFLYFAQPIWYGAQLQALTVWVMRGALALTGPPALVEGDFIHLSNATFIIEEGCSGLHFMIVGLAVAVLYGEQRHDSWPVRARQLALLGGLALLANWVRVYTVIQAGYLTNMQSYLVRVSHYGFGWGVFAVALFVFFWLAPYLGPVSPPPPVVAVPAPPSAVERRAELTGMTLAVAILLALPALNWTLRKARPCCTHSHPGMPRRSMCAPPGCRYSLTPTSCSGALSALRATTPSRYSASRTASSARARSSWARAARCSAMGCSRWPSRWSAAGQVAFTKPRLPIARERVLLSGGATRSPDATSLAHSFNSCGTGLTHSSGSLRRG